MVTVPSEFVKRSFVEMGMPKNKIAKIPYGASLDRFSKNADPSKDSLRMLWVGAVSIRKGFMYALEAFQKLKHPKKEFWVVGSISQEMEGFLKSSNVDGVDFKGIVPNTELPKIYSASHAFVLSSIQEGLAMVQGEALACGCPVIATTNTGAEDLLTDGKEGFIVPVRSPEMIAERLEELAQCPDRRMEMSEAALKRVQSLGGWNTYGENFISVLNSL